jgi:hypothetical protein
LLEGIRFGHPTREVDAARVNLDGARFSSHDAALRGARRLT